MIRLGVLGSTRGTNLLSIAEAIEAKQMHASVSIVISNKADALILSRGKHLGFATEYVDPVGLSREAYDQKISALLLDHQVDLVVLIGYMRILSSPFVAAWRDKIINIHPSLLPAFAGKMDLEVHRAVIESQVKETGCTVHYVTEAVDEGPILLQKKCPVFPSDTPETLKQRVQTLEGAALVEAIEQLALLHPVDAI